MQTPTFLSKYRTSGNVFTFPRFEASVPIENTLSTRSWISFSLNSCTFCTTTWTFFGLRRVIKHNRKQPRWTSRTVVTVRMLHRMKYKMPSAMELENEKTSNHWTLELCNLSNMLSCLGVPVNIIHATRSYAKFGCTNLTFCIITFKCRTNPTVLLRPFNIKVCFAFFL